MNRKHAGLGALAVVAFGGSVSAATLLGPLPYLSTSDSPLKDYPGFVVGTMESGTLPPAIVFNAGTFTNPGTFTDSVDGDDGTFDGSGSAGRSYYLTVAVVTIDFATGRGNFPTAAGLVWTDVGNSGLRSGEGRFSVEAFDPEGNLLGVIGPVVLGDGVATGGTAEDRFFGFLSPGGISTLRVVSFDSVDWELDHVQYAYIPEPAALGLLAPAMLALSRARRR